MKGCASLTQKYAKGESLSEAEKAFIWHTIDEEKQGPEETIREAMADMFTEQGARVVARMERRARRRMAGDGPEALKLSADSFFDIGAAIQELFGSLADGLLEALQLGFRTGAIRVEHDGTFDAGDPRIQNAVEQINSNLSDVPRHTRRLINEAILKGESSGESIDEIASRVQREFQRMSDVRARRIAATTTTAAFEAGQQTAFEEAGMTGSMWLSQRDSRVRGRQQDAGHWEADGQMARLNETFQVAPGAGRPKEPLRYPGDPRGSAGNVINCRCTRLPRMDLQ